MKIRVVPYKRGSQSAKIMAEKLSNLLGYKVYRGLPKRNRININWGSNLWRIGAAYVNNPIYVSVARNKLKTFEALDGEVPIPEYTNQKEVAEGWLSDGKTVLARTTTGQGGSGISICSDHIVDAPLYTVYIKKRKEFRVHVVGNEVISVAEKRKRRGNVVDTFIRSHRRGWVFCKQNVEEPEDLRAVAVKAVKTLGLDFGGVDVIWNQKRSQCYVLEVNTAPGVDNQTGDLYASALLNSERLVSTHGVGSGL